MAHPRPSARTGNTVNSHRSSNGKVLSYRTFLTCIACCVTSFYIGLMLGMNHTHEIQHDCHCKDGAASASTTTTASESTASLFNPLGSSKGKGTRFPPSMESLFAGAARVNRDDFMDKFDLGVPRDKTLKGNEEALILYHHAKSLSNVSTGEAVGGNGDIPLLSVQDAAINCDILKIILTEPNKPRQCMAIVGQWESYHIHKYMRLPDDSIRTGVNANLPLRPVARTHSANKGRAQLIPRTYNVERYDQTILLPYLQALKATLAKLKPIAQKVAKDTNTVVVLVCNLGQSELLVNFICNARSKGFDLSQVLVFTTDTETQEIVEALGVATFYDDVIFDKMPDQAAGRYGDGKFTAMMMAKVFCVHLLTQLDFNVLFQDVDVVWHRNPLDYFLNEVAGDFDLYFQDDGAHSVRYAPYSPNTGFYFVRAVDRTRYFFNCFVKLSDMIQQSGSHQSALTSLLNEHVSYRGLTVKIFSRDGDEFPGGFHYHRSKEYMKKFVAGEVHPYIFHMSWTTNKENKRKFFQQMGDWHVQDQCVGKKIADMKMPGKDNVTENCCTIEPLVECHYKDKPSKIPCKDKPPIDKGKPSWW